MAARKTSRKIRTAQEFTSVASAMRALQPPPSSSRGIYGWDLDAIRNARDLQMLGSFYEPSRLAESMRTDDALFTAYTNRLAPQRCLAVEVEAAKGRRGDSVAAEAVSLFGSTGTGVRVDTLADVSGCLANHGVAFAIVDYAARDDGSRVDAALRYWPIEHVRWDTLKRSFTTRVDQVGADVPITHGDGRWVVFSKHEHEGWKQDACILPAALVWARHAFAARDWARGSTSHGNVKVVGELPEGVLIADESGSLTPEATAFGSLLQAIASLEAPVGIRPAGSKTELLANNSTAWQVWQELMLNAEKAAARIYLGTDGTLGSVGGAPGVDIATLFGVATTKVQGDLFAIERGILEGIIEPWCAINFGDSSLAPTRRYVIPDLDEEATVEARGKRYTAFFDALERYRQNGLLVTQEVVDDLAETFRIPAPVLKPALP